jgi:hypothetical protein
LERTLIFPEMSFALVGVDLLSMNAREKLLEFITNLLQRFGGYAFNILTYIITKVLSPEKWPIHTLYSKTTLE